ncbi:hypothetical protein PGTUg99_034478, partial [Puccinia graminis f. sp. tritici]
MEAGEIILASLGFKLFCAHQHRRFFHVLFISSGRRYYPRLKHLSSVITSRQASGLLAQLPPPISMTSLGVHNPAGIRDTPT